MPIKSLRVFGKSVQNGVPSPTAPVSITSVGDKGTVKVDIIGKNLFDLNKMVDNENVKKIAYDTIRVSTLPGSSGVNSSGVPNNKLKTYAPHLVIGKTYVFNADSTGTEKCIYLQGSNVTWWFNTPKVITQEMLDSEVLWYASGVSTSAIIKNIQLEEGSVATYHEPYRIPQSIAIQTPNSLFGIKVTSGSNYTDSTGQQWICDEIDLARGKYVQRVAKLIFDGNEKWIPYENKEYKGYYLENILPFDSNRRNGICNKYKVDTDMMIKDEGLWLGVHNNYVYVHNSRFYDRGLTSFLENLKKEPMEIYTYLDSPIEHDIASEQIAIFKQLHTNNPTTIISNDENADMELTYTVNTKSYVDTKIAEISGAVIAQKGV